MPLEQYGGRGSMVRDASKKRVMSKMLSAYCEDLIRNRLAKLSGIQSDLVVMPSTKKEIEDADAPWIAVVRAQSPQFELAFKTHFSRQNARIFAHHCFGEKHFDDSI